MGNSSWAAAVKTADWSNSAALDAKIAGLSERDRTKLRMGLEAVTAEENGFTIGQFNNVQKAFDAIDMNKNGNIDYYEFAALLDILGIVVTEKECQGVFDMCCVNGKFAFEQYLLLIIEGLQVKAEQNRKLRIANTPSTAPSGKSFTISFDLMFEHIKNWYIEVLYHTDAGDGHFRMFCHGNHPWWTEGAHMHENLAGLMKLSIKGGTTGGDGYGDLTAPKRVVPGQWHSIVIIKTPSSLTFMMDGEKHTMLTAECEVKGPEHIMPSTDSSVPASWSEENKKEKRAGRKRMYGEIRNFSIQYGQAADDVLHSRPVTTEAPNEANEALLT